MPECDNCGDDLEHPRDKMGNRWRDTCFPCIEDLADADPPDTPVHKRESYIEWLHSDRRE